MCKAYVVVELPDGKRRRVLAAIDTQSNATFISRTIGEPRKWDRRESNTVQGLGRSVVTEPAKTVIVTDTEKVLEAAAACAQGFGLFSGAGSRFGL